MTKKVYIEFKTIAGNKKTITYEIPDYDKSEREVLVLDLSRAIAYTLSELIEGQEIKIKLVGCTT